MSSFCDVFGQLAKLAIVFGSHISAVEYLQFPWLYTRRWTYRRPPTRGVLAAIPSRRRSDPLMFAGKQLRCEGAPTQRQAAWRVLLARRWRVHWTYCVELELLTSFHHEPFVLCSLFIAALCYSVDQHSTFFTQSEWMSSRWRWGWVRPAWCPLNRYDNQNRSGSGLLMIIIRFGVVVLVDFSVFITVFSSLLTSTHALIIW